MGEEGGRTRYRCLLFRSTPDLCPALPETPPATLVLKAPTFYSRSPRKQPGNAQTDGLNSSILFGAAFDSWQISTTAFREANFGRSLLLLIFFLGHGENFGEKPTPLSTSGLSIAVFEFPSPLWKEAARISTYLEYTQHLLGMTCQAVKIRCPTEEFSRT